MWKKFFIFIVFSNGYSSVVKLYLYLNWFSILGGIANKMMGVIFGPLSTLETNKYFYRFSSLAYGCHAQFHKFPNFKPFLLSSIVPTWLWNISLLKSCCIKFVSIFRMFALIFITEIEVQFSRFVRFCYLAYTSWIRRFFFFS